MTDKIDRRSFIGSAISYAATLTVCGLSELSVASLADQVVHYCVADNELVNLKSQNLSFGTSIYPFRKNMTDPAWFLNECTSMGFTEIRYSFPQERARAFDVVQNPNPEIVDMLRNSGFDTILTVDGDESHLPRLPNGAIDCAAASHLYANYTRWLVGHTKDFVNTYELWSDPFTKSSSQAKHNLAFGGDKPNANSYGTMMLPAMAEIRQSAKNAKVAVEGNYSDVEKSADSANYRKLLAQADFVTRQTYGYDPALYSDGTGFICQATDAYKKINPHIKWWYSEYNVSARDLALSPEEMKGVVQAKGILRATVLPLRNGVEHLDISALYHPTLPQLSLCNRNRSRRSAWHTMHKLIGSCAPKKQSITSTLQRTTALPPNVRDMAIATTNGFTYLAWKETDITDLARRMPEDIMTIGLKCNDGKKLRIVNVTDPVLGRPIIVHPGPPTEHLTMHLPVVDYPYLCELQVIG